MLRVRFHLLFSLLAISACSSESSKKDPVAEAQFQNEKRIGDADITNKQERDAAFMVDVASDGLLEMELGRLAQQQAASPAVKEFGQRMATQHGEVSQALNTLAKQKGIVLPAGLGEKQQEARQTLAALSGAAFDEKYMAQMVDDHANDVDKFDDMSEDAYDGDIRGFAAKYLPTLKEHHELAQQVRDQLKATP